MKENTEFKDKGAIYVATGTKYIEMALQSAKSLKKHNPNLPIHLFTDVSEINSPYIDSAELLTEPHKRSKVDCMHKTPFNQTLFLDADTFVLDKLDDLFDLLKRFDLAMSHAHRRNNARNTRTWKTTIPYSFPQLNSGVILYDKRKTKKLFIDWQNAYHEAGFSSDQVTLRELIWESQLNLGVLPPEYNIRFKKFLNIWTKEEVKPKILHYEEFTVFFDWVSKVSGQ